MTSILTTGQREQLHRQLDELLDSLPAKLDDLGQAEQELQAGLRRLGAASLQHWADSASTASPVPACSDCGQPMRHRGLARCTLTTVLGPVHYRRPRRRCDRCGRESYPHDHKLRFQSHGVSWNLAAVVTRLASLLPSFDAARQLLAEEHAIELSKQTIEQLTHRAGRILMAQDDAKREAFFAEATKRPASVCESPPFSPEMVAVYADGAKLHAEGDWREIRVGRSIAWDVEGKRLGQRTFARFLPLEAFGQQLFLEAQRAGYAQAKKRAFLGDGAHWLWELAAMHFPEAVPILDWYHLSKNVHQAAGEVFGEGSDGAAAWAEERLAELWNGQQRVARRVTAELRKQVRSKSKREALRKLGVYLKNNAERTDYPRYRALGLPIGSGPVESACKKLVAGRCKQSGMRNWRRQRAESVLRLRAAQWDGDFTTLWSTRLRQAA